MGFTTLSYLWTLDGFVFNAGGEVDSAPYLDQCSGWYGMPAVRSNKKDRVARNGIYLGGVYYGPRIIEISGYVLNENTYERDQSIDLLQQVLSADGLTRKELTRTEGDRSRMARVAIDDDVEITVQPDGLSLRWNTQLIAPDPRIWSPAPVLSGPVGLDDRGASAGGFLYNGTAASGSVGTQWNGFAAPYAGTVYQSAPSAATSGRLALSNEGNTPAPLKITITAVTNVTNPGVTLIGTGELLVFNGILTAGSVLTIDTGTGRTYLNGNYAPGVLSVGQMFQLAPGGNELNFTSVSVSEQAFLTTEHYHAYKGG